MLVNCVAYQNGKKLAEITQREIKSYLSRPDCFVWVALRDADAAELAMMQDEFDLHELAVEDARHGHQRPKTEEYGDSLFVVMQTIEVVGDELKVGEVDIFVGRNYVLSARQNSERGFTEVRARCEREPELLQHGSGYVLYALMDALVDRYSPVLDAVSAGMNPSARPAATVARTMKALSVCAPAGRRPSSRISATSRDPPPGQRWCSPSTPCWTARRMRASSESSASWPSWTIPSDVSMAPWWQGPTGRAAWWPSPRRSSTRPATGSAPCPSPTW